MSTNKSPITTQRQITTNSDQLPYNRANDVRRDDDLKELSIGLKDLDYAIKYYFDNVIRPEIDDYGTKRSVPVIYGSPEKWKNVQEDGYFRDKDGKIIAPVIAYKRTSLTKNRSLSSKVDANFPQVYYSQQVKYSDNNKYDQFSKLTNRTPVKTFINTVMADYVDITYDVVVWTDYVEQMNNIVEAIMYSEGSFWGEKERFKFRTKIDSFTNTTDLLQDSERIVRTNFTITMFGYIVPDVLVKNLSEKLSGKTYSLSQLRTDVEVDIEVDPISVGQAQPSVGSAVLGSTKGTTQLPNATLAYLNTNKAVERTSVTVPNTALFTATWLDAPSGLPTTTVSSFTFFINGTYVEPSAITSFVQNGNGTCTLTLDVGNLGFTLIAADEVVAIGKFA